MVGRKRYFEWTKLGGGTVSTTVIAKTPKEGTISKIWDITVHTLDHISSCRTFILHTIATTITDVAINSPLIIPPGRYSCKAFCKALQSTLKVPKEIIRAAYWTVEFPYEYSKCSIDAYRSLTSSEL